jgi:hypothetical protein
MTSVDMPALFNLTEDVPTVEELAAQVAGLTRQVAELTQQASERTHQPAAAGGQPPLYENVEQWVRDYLLPTFRRPFGQVGLVRWHWCEQWWRHDEAVTRLMALWYGWEHARLEMTGMIGWLHELDYQLQYLCGEEGPFRDCSPGGEHGEAQHKVEEIAPVAPAPDLWWSWWSDGQ